MPEAQLVVSAVCGFLISALCVVFALRYARRRGLLDRPGQRRSHALPTPRGGGIGIVAGALIAGASACLLEPETWTPVTVAVIAVAVLAVAIVGWRDDHAPLSILPRIGVHVLASIGVGFVLLWPAALVDQRLWWWLVAIVPLIAGSINAHNFMDGIDGLLGLQALFVLISYALLARVAGDFALTAASLGAAAACLGFLIFNLPPARIFMGDVGSGTLGLLIGAFAGLLVQRHPEWLWACAILSSGFLVDAGLTLFARVLNGRRWYTAHREHLYQWMVRADLDHAQTDGVYMLWNLIVAAPAAWLAAHLPPMRAFVLCAAVYVLAGVLWIAGKRACLRTVQRGHA
ncbi:MAG: glycosyl transferase family 4 [Rhodanobacteraceae bacterium]